MSLLHNYAEGDSESGSAAICI